MAFVKKIRLFIIYVFWANQARKDRFLVILDKKIFSTPKKKLLKKSKNSKFSKRVSPYGFCRKIELSVIYVFWANQARKDRFLVYWIKKNVF